MHYTYAHIRNDTGKIFYIGKGVKYRCNETRSRNQYWKNIVEKYGYKIEILAYWKTAEEAYDHEKLLISCFKDMEYNLANLTDGGEGCISPSKETKEKIANSLKGRKRTKQECENIAKGKKGKPHSQEHNAKISASCKNILRSEEVKKRMSLAQKARWAKLND